MSSPIDTLEFVAFHQPGLPDGDYELHVKQQVHIESSGYGWGSDQWSSAPGNSLQFSVAGPRFSLDPALIQAQFPASKSSGEYYNVLPHIILGRSTLPWERSIDHAPPQAEPKPWLALLLFDASADQDAPKTSTVSVQELLSLYGTTASPPGQPEFVKILPRDAAAKPGPGELKLELGQHLADRLTVIDVSTQLLWQILPREEELALLSHVRVGQDAKDPSKRVEYPIILCKRLPGPGARNGDARVGTRSTVHLVSLEARKPLLDALAALDAAPPPGTLVRLVSLASWSFSTMQRDKTFSTWLKDAWCPEPCRVDGADSNAASSCATSVVHTLRMPVNDHPDAERLLGQGYAPIKHQTRQGNHLVSWYRGPLLPGQSPPLELALPVQASDQLTRYFDDVGMFDTSYAAAWELGRLLTLRSKNVSISLLKWKRALAQQLHQSTAKVSHLPFAPDHSVAPEFPEVVSEWFTDLLTLKHVPFHYLVPREEMLPPNSLRFFHLDKNWLACLLDGAFSVGRVGVSDRQADAATRTVGHLPSPQPRSGFILRSPVVTGWPNLAVEATTSSNQPATRVRGERVGADILFYLFEGDIKTIDIHEHRETIHFGVETGADPTKLEQYRKLLRDIDSGTPRPEPVDLTWTSKEKRSLDISDLAEKARASNAAQFALGMIEGVEKVRFMKKNG